MSEVLVTSLIAYATMMTVGFGGLVVATATAPMRMVVFAMMLLMAAAPSSPLGGPRW